MSERSFLSSRVVTWHPILTFFFLFLHFVKREIPAGFKLLPDDVVLVDSSLYLGSHGKLLCRCLDIQPVFFTSCLFF
jgi:hypothetical protein